MRGEQSLQHAKQLLPQGVASLAWAAAELAFLRPPLMEALA